MTNNEPHDLNIFYFSDVMSSNISTATAGFRHVHTCFATIVQQKRLMCLPVVKPTFYRGLSSPMHYTARLHQFHSPLKSPVQPCPREPALTSSRSRGLLIFHTTLVLNLRPATPPWQPCGRRRLDPSDVSQATRRLCARHVRLLAAPGVG